MSVSMIDLSPAFAEALLEWDDRLWKMFQARAHAQTMIPTLKDLNMAICAKKAQTIFQDLDLQMRTGELLIRLRESFLDRHELSPVEYEQWRQFTNVAMVFYELSEDEARTEYGEKTVESHGAYIEAAEAAVSMQEAMQ